MSPICPQAEQGLTENAQVRAAEFEAEAAAAKRRVLEMEAELARKEHEVLQMQQLQTAQLSSPRKSRMAAGNGNGASSDYVRELESTVEALKKQLLSQDKIMETRSWFKRCVCVMCFVMHPLGRDTPTTHSSSTRCTPARTTTDELRRGPTYLHRRHADGREGEALALDRGAFCV